ncbi:putative bifunctional diguanylate cyclase/phosphodiesterase [Aurantimonas coralicida]|uniref:putative bifunctional diguanylate cyclase/phosphodiesterase n=1 Tax=Aurantimonas coralicida TaxID=182270 RepID=UPI001D189BE1|nr:EAL domain-containing protein [Aurantimonas coralicida]MCC4296348.1 EAL domain-containing protein [Aurantimonas coralicida]
MPLRLKLLVGCLCLTLVTLGLGVFAQHSQRGAGDLATRIYDEALLSLSYLRSAQNSLLQIEMDDLQLRSGEVRGDGEAFLSAQTALSTSLPDIMADLDVASERAMSPGGRRKIGEIRTGLQLLQQDFSTLDNTQLRARFSALDGEFDTAVEILAGDGYRFRREVGELIEASMHSTQGAMAAAVVLAVMISLMLARMIVPPLNRAVQVAESIARGKLDNEIVPHGHDETAQLMRALATMQRSIGEHIGRIRELMAEQADSYDSHIAIQNSRFEAALNNMTQGLCLFDVNERLVIFNRRFAEMFGGLQIGVSARQVLLDPEIQHLLAPGPDGSFTHELPDGRMIATSRQAIEGGGWLDTFEDVTDQYRAQAKLSHMALHDALTGLPNRVQFRDRLETATRTAAGIANTSVLCLDLDGFKAVNDTLGHPTGDALLRAAAARLLSCVRQGDLVARVGGDEFSIIQSAGDPHLGAASLAQRIVDAFVEPFPIDGRPICVGVSVGIFVTAEMAEAGRAIDPDTIIKNADVALYRAKSEGRGTFRFFEPDMDAGLEARRQLELDLRLAVENEEFALFYQPFVDVERQVVTGFEALLRWHHPQRGLVSPAEFIPVAEDCGLMAPLGVWVLETACRQAAKWPSDLAISVNLSPVQFRDPGLADIVEAALERAGLAPERLRIEVTESLLLQDSATVLATLKRFRDHGIGISMDDFGTGYSSLGYLSRFPFDKIKIDQSFVRHIDDHENMAIIRAVIGLSRAMDLSVIAEGVETSAQRDILLREGCREMQGYFFSPPKPADELARMLLTCGRGTVEDDEAVSAELVCLPPSPAADAGPRARALPG